MGVLYLDIWRKKLKEEQESAGGHWDQQLHQIFLQVPSFMYDFFTSLGMHGICMWIFGCDLLLAWRMVSIDSELHRLSISWITMVIVGLFPCCVFGWISCFISLG